MSKERGAKMKDLLKYYIALQPMICKAMGNEKKDDIVCAGGGMSDG